MCRIAAAVGTPRPLSALIFDPPHSLERQAYAPLEMVRGHVNVDGTGVAWWPEGETEPLRYITERPPWSDPNLSTLSSRLRGTTILAAIRSATPGVPFGPDNVQPFVADGIAGVHNGWIGGWGGPITADLLARLGPESLAQLRVMNDSRVVVLSAIELVTTGTDLGVALAQVVRETVQLVEKHGEAASLNIALAGRDRVVAVRAAHEVDSNTLYTDTQGGRLASEPLDGAGWEEVPADHLVDLRPGSITVRPYMEVL